MRPTHHLDHFVIDCLQLLRPDARVNRATGQGDRGEAVCHAAELEALVLRLTELGQFLKHLFGELLLLHFLLLLKLFKLHTLFLLDEVLYNFNQLLVGLRVLSGVKLVTSNLLGCRELVKVEDEVLGFLRVALLVVHELLLSEFVFFNLLNHFLGNRNLAFFLLFENCLLLFLLDRGLPLLSEIMPLPVCHPLDCPGVFSDGSPLGFLLFAFLLGFLLVFLFIFLLPHLPSLNILNVLIPPE